MLDVMNKTQNKKLLAPERGEPERSGGEPNGGANNRAAETAVPNPEVVARSQRHRFSVAPTDPRDDSSSLGIGYLAQWRRASHIPPEKDRSP